jgi:hypothetical protein
LAGGWAARKGVTMQSVESAVTTCGDVEAPRE